MPGIMINLLIVGAGGFLGAISRYGLSTWLHKQYEGSFPLGCASHPLLASDPASSSGLVTHRA